VNALSQLSSALLPAFPPQGREGKPLGPSPFPGNMADGLTQNPLVAETGGSEFAWHREYIRAAQLPRKPPQREGFVSAFLAQIQGVWEESREQLMAEMKQLRTEYVFRNDGAICRFLSSHRAAGTALSRAIPELRRSFGQDAVFNLEATSEEDGSTTLYAIVVWRGPVRGAESALEDFDERWWLSQAPLAGVTFTYELA
jgi:hypothetical protein